MKNILNFKLVILIEYQNIKIYLLKITFQIGLKKFLGLKNVPMTYVFSILKAKRLLEQKKQIKKSLELKSNKDKRR